MSRPTADDVIEVVDHDPRSARQFDVLAARYRAALAGVPVVAIEHVGSTAVPGLAAKPIIDVDIVVEAPHVDAACTALASIGYEPLGELGVPDRWAFRAPPGSIRTNTYVIVRGCLAHRNHLAVRDTLRRDAVSREEYAGLKRRLSTTVDDIDTYVEAKSAVIQTILARADMGEADRLAVERINRRSS